MQVCTFIFKIGSSIHVAVSQIKDVFGLKNVAKFEGIFKVPKVQLIFGIFFIWINLKNCFKNMFKTLYDLVLRLPSSNWVTFGFSSGCMLFLIVCKELGNPVIKKYLKFEFPSELLLVNLNFLLSTKTFYN